MACCGNRRLAAGAMSSATSAGSVAAARPAPVPESRRSGVAYFQYTGQSGIVVTGPTGSRYRFEASGAIVPVALADRASLAALPQLRQVAGP